MHALTCTIITKDEADRVGRCLESVRGLAAEIVVVDSGSTDGTLALCRAAGARVFHNDWVGYGQQKRFAEARASHDWILNLDADEWLTPEARAEIAAVLGRPVPPEVHGFEFRIRQVYPGATRPRPFADDHRYVRLYDRRRCRFPESAVFDEVKLPRANKRPMRAPVYHQSIRSLRHLWEKNLRYYRLQRGEIAKGPLEVALRILVEPFTIFFKYYILKRHITGGLYGLAVAATVAALRTYRLAILFSDKRR